MSAWRRMLFAWVVFGLAAGATAHADEPTLLRIGHVGHDHQIALFVAAERGEALRAESGGVWFREKKAREVYDLLDGDAVLAQVNLRKVGGGANMPAALARGEIEIGVGGVAATVAAIDRGASFRIVLGCNCDGDMLMVRPDLPAKTWDEFLAHVKESEKPVRIGYKAPRAVAYLIFMAALDEVGVTYGPKEVGEDGERVQVVLVNLNKGGNMIPSLKGGIVDGIVMNQPVVAIAAHKGVGRVVADLRDLPPAGKWANHPCCCVVATDGALRGKRAAVKALLQAMIAGDRYIKTHMDQAIPLAAKWTKAPLEVEKKSIPTVTYVSLPDAGWRKGMATWFAMMKDLDQFAGKLRDMEPEAMHEAVSDYALAREAAQALPPAE